MKWKNIKLAGKFSISFGIIIMLLLFVSYWGVDGIHEIVSDAEEVIDGNNLRSNIEEKHIQHLKWAIALNQYVIDDEVRELKVQTDHHKCAFGEWYYGEGRKHTENIAPELKPIFDKMEEPHKHLHESAIEIQGIMDKNNFSANGVLKAKGIYLNKTQTRLNEIGQLFGEAIDESKKYLMTDETMIENANAHESEILLFSIVIVAIAIVLAIVIARGIIKPVKKSVKFAEEIASGDLKTSISIHQNDEIGILAKSLLSMKNKLNDIVVEIIQGANNVASASQLLSSGASEQAASTEEVSSSMEQMIANIEQNADNAMQTETIANKAAHEIAIGFNNVSETVKSMQEVAEKISIIEEIAEKTDLLAINAAIEAARAGEHGKGFAVVAMEIRKLAERSQNAAADINGLSKSSVKISEEAGRKMSEIVPEIEKTSSLVQEIAAASKEQSAGADQVNSALQQLNLNNQSTASNAEELAAQAEVLKDAVSFFKVNNLSTERKSNLLRSTNGNTKNKKVSSRIEEKPVLLDNFLETVKDNDFETF